MTIDLSASKHPLYWHMNRAIRCWHRLKALAFYRYVFGSFGAGSRLAKPGLLHEPHLMHIGSGVRINFGVRMEAIVTPNHPAPELRIGNNVNIEQNVHIICHNKVLIGNNVSIAGYTVITDTTHPFDGIPQSQKTGVLIQDDDKTVEIGEGTFIGMHCIILPGVRIGSFCMVGAGSVVSHDIPSCTVAVGSPASVVRAISRPQDSASASHADTHAPGWSPSRNSRVA